jgi:hypothetical protein
MRSSYARPIFVSVALFCVFSISMIGCDKSPDTPAVTQDTAESTPASPPPAPTTRDLMEGPRTPLAMKIAPLALQVPAGWKVEVLGESAMLEGPTPSGDGQIVVATLPGMSSQRVDMLVAGAKTDGSTEPGKYAVTDVPSLHGMHVLDRLTYTSPAATQPTTEPTAETADADPLNGPLVSWERIVFVPEADSFMPTSFSISGMTPREYAQDQPFFQSILDTVEQQNQSDAQ